jgi:hypothetical protein
MENICTLLPLYNYHQVRSSRTVPLLMEMLSKNSAILIVSISILAGNALLQKINYPSNETPNC